MNKVSSFWMVLSENSNYTHAKHPSFAVAKAEAERLAAKDAGVRFFVLQSVGSAIIRNPVEWEEHDEIPF